MHLEFSMGSSASGGPLTLVALRSVLPGWCSHVSRALPAFQDAASELYEMVGESRAAWAGATPRRHALAIAAHVSQRLQSVELLLPVPADRAFAAASLYRLSRIDAFPSFFEEGWQSAYQALALLFGASCDSAEALRLVGRLLSAAPSPDPTSSLDARVRLLLPHLDTAVLRGASARDRTTAMEALLKSGSAPAGGPSTDPNNTSTTADEKDPVMWGRVFAQPQSKALFLLLDPLNVTPLVEYRVARVLLADVSPIGVHVIAKGVKVPSLLFRSIKAGFSQAAALLALQRTMCIDPTNTLRLDWFPAFDAASLTKLVAGKWWVGASSAATVDLWGEFVGRLYVFQKGPYSLSMLNAFSPTGFFCDEFALRVGSPIITAVWAFIGVGGPATLVGSVAWTLQELHSRAEKVACWTQVFAETRLACQALLSQAGARAFSDAGVAWALMLEAPVELAVKPTLLTPPPTGFTPSSPGATRSSPAQRSRSRSSRIKPSAATLLPPPPAPPLRPTSAPSDPRPFRPSSPLGPRRRAGAPSLPPPSGHPPPTSPSRTSAPRARPPPPTLLPTSAPPSPMFRSTSHRSCKPSPTRTATGVATRGAAPSTAAN